MQPSFNYLDIGRLVHFYKVQKHLSRILKHHQLRYVWHNQRKCKFLGRPLFPGLEKMHNKFEQQWMWVQQRSFLSYTPNTAVYFLLCQSNTIEINYKKRNRSYTSFNKTKSTKLPYVQSSPCFNFKCRSWVESWVEIWGSAFFLIESYPTKNLPKTGYTSIISYNF